MEKGQKIYVEPKGNASRRDSNIKECVVSKVGRKYFEVDGLHRIRFFIDTMEHDGGEYSSQYKAYESMQEILDIREANRLFDNIRTHFSGYTTNLPLSKLKAIKNILDNE